MKLSINTSSITKIAIALDGKIYESETKQKSSQLLLSLITESLEANSMTLKDVTEIEVETGPGSFTGLRVGVSVAQTLGWSLGVSVNGQYFNKMNSLKINYE